MSTLKTYKFYDFPPSESFIKQTYNLSSSNLQFFYPSFLCHLLPFDFHVSCNSPIAYRFSSIKKTSKEKENCDLMMMTRLTAEDPMTTQPLTTNKALKTLKKVLFVEQNALLLKIEFFCVVKGVCGHRYFF